MEAIHDLEATLNYPENTHQSNTGNRNKVGVWSTAHNRSGSTSSTTSRTSVDMNYSTPSLPSIVNVQPRTSSSRIRSSGVSLSWSCSICTFRNPADASVCQVCLVKKE